MPWSLVKLSYEMTSLPVVMVIRVKAMGGYPGVNTTDLAAPAAN